MKGVLPTKRQVIAELSRQIEDRRIVLRVLGDDPAPISLHALRCLEIALLVVKERKWPK